MFMRCSEVACEILEKYVFERSNVDEFIHDQIIFGFLIKSVWISHNE